MHSANQCFRAIVDLMRPRDWIKNGFVLAPLLFSGRIVSVEPCLQALRAFGLFCLAASAAYVVNDLRDIDRDRMHPLKRQTKPLAAGRVSVRGAQRLLALLVSALVATSWSTPRVAMVVAGYLGLSMAYSFWLKDQPVLDLFSIASGFVLRVQAGATAIGVPLSDWMFITTLCLALYMASIKRRQELLFHRHHAREVLSHYGPALLNRFAELAGTGALVFYSLFVMATHPSLVLTIPLVLFGLFRYWYLSERDDALESPTETVLRDSALQWVIAAWIAASSWGILSQRA